MRWRPDAPVKELEVKRHDSNVRFLYGRNQEIGFCSADPDAEHIISIMEKITEDQQMEITHLRESVLRLDKEVVAAKAKLRAYEEMEFFARARFAFYAPKGKKNELRRRLVEWLY